MNLAILGAGSWGTALSIVLAPRCETLRLWVYEADLAERMSATRINDVFLPDAAIPPVVEITGELSDALRRVDVVLGVMPSHFARAIYSKAVPYLPLDAVIVSATKGIEQNSLLRMSQVIDQVVGASRPVQTAVLSGPTFAREVAAGEPTALVVASHHPRTAAKIQQQFSGPTFRLYTNSDPIGVEIGAALKNVIAIAAGVCQGLNLGSNARAGLITRGLAEITRLAVAMGAQPRTLAGLAGLGDLVLTCTGELSRNRQVGIELAAGRTLGDITGSMRMIAEGVETVEAAVALGETFQVDLPIIRKMHDVLHGRGIL